MTYGPKLWCVQWRWFGAMSLACCWHCVPLCFPGDPRTSVRKCAHRLRRSRSLSQVTIFLARHRKNPDAGHQRYIFPVALEANLISWTSSPGPHLWEPQHPIRGHTTKPLNPESAISLPHENLNDKKKSGPAAFSCFKDFIRITVTTHNRHRFSPTLEKCTGPWQINRKHCGSTFASSSPSRTTCRRGHTLCPDTHMWVAVLLFLVRAPRRVSTVLHYSVSKAWFQSL